MTKYLKLPHTHQPVRYVLSGVMFLSACGGGDVADYQTTAQAEAHSVTVPSAIAAVTAASASSTQAGKATVTIQQVVRNRPANTGTGTGTNTYYIDSRVGNDAFNGRSAAVVPTGTGPWKTLAKLATVALAPGDSVQLACGAVWKETLTLASSGTVDNPISVSSFPSTCSNPPVIDGSVALGAAIWTQHKGGIYKAPLASEPLQLNGTAGTFTIAHFPNRGFDKTLLTSLYLRTAASSDNANVNGRSASTYLVSGSDLKLPAGATLTAGTKLRIRTNSWIIDETTIASVSGTRINLSAPTSALLQAGWGYYFFGKAWMLDSPGEWFFDANAKMLYAWMPDSAAPQTVFSTQLATGINLNKRKYVKVDGLSIKLVGTGVDMSNTTGVELRNMRIEDTSAFGVDAATAVSGVLEKNIVSRTALDAISGASATGLRVTNNTIQQSGVVVSGDSVISLPVRTYAAIRAGASAQVTGNAVADTGYMGIWPMPGSNVSNNHVRGACSMLDDCAGIYVSGANHNSAIKNNVVERSRGSLDGKSSSTPYTQAQGIYLDEGASGITVDGNSVVDTDNGIQLHVAANNIITNNKLYGNRRSQIWLQETSNKVRSTGDVFGNTVSGNQIVATTAAARGFLLETQIDNSELFGQFDWNQYFDRVFARVGSDINSRALTDYTIVDWKNALKSNGTPRAQDPNGRAASELLFAAALVAGPNIVPNGSLTINAQGWSAWNQTAPFGTLVRESCAAGSCLRYVAGYSTGLISTPNFSVVAGKWYRVSADIMTGRDAQTLNMLVRRGGGGSNGYEALTGVSMTVSASRTWKRFNFIFQATKTVNANDPVTLDLGARLDFNQIQPGDVVNVSNVEIVPTATANVSTRSDMLLNTSAATAQVNCPVAATQPSVCATYVRLSDNAIVTWPYSLPARGSEVVYTRDVNLVDSDGDGIADSQDACASTPRGSAVNARGCGFGQGS